MAGLLNPCLTDVKLVCLGRGRGVALHTKQRKFAFHRLKLDHPLPSPHDDCVNIGNVVSIIPIFLCHCIQHQRDHCFEVFLQLPCFTALGHSGEYSNAAKLAGKMSKSVMQLISIHF